MSTSSRPGYSVENPRDRFPPGASRSRINETQMRWPRMQRFPKQMLGLIGLRERSSSRRINTKLQKQAPVFRRLLCCRQRCRLKFKVDYADGPDGLDASEQEEFARKENTGRVWRTHPRAKEYDMAVGSRICKAGCGAGQTAFPLGQERKISSGLAVGGIGRAAW